MRAAALVAISVMALAACSPGGGSSSTSGGNASPSASGGAFPTGNGPAFKQEATMTMAGQNVAETIYHDGARTRTDRSGGPTGDSISVMNMETRQGFNIMHMMGRTIATRIDLSQQSTPSVSADQIEQMRAQMKDRAHQVGTCSAAGESGAEWEVAPPPGVPASGMNQTMCMTSDGIMLQMKMNGAVVFNTTSLQRGPQDASLFEPPAGVQFTEIHAPSQADINAMAARARAAAAQYGTH